MLTIYFGSQFDRWINFPISANISLSTSRRSELDVCLNQNNDIFRWITYILVTKEVICLLKEQCVVFSSFSICAFPKAFFRVLLTSIIVPFDAKLEGCCEIMEVAFVFESGLFVTATLLDDVFKQTPPPPLVLALLMLLPFSGNKSSTKVNWKKVLKGKSFHQYNS